MKANRFIAFVLAVGAVFTAPTVVLAQSAEKIKSEFILGEETLPTPIAQIGDHYYEAGVVEYFGEEVAPITLENDIFDKALPYMCYGGGSTNRWDCFWDISLSCPEYDEDDVVYMSFYYKSASSFKGVNGVKYTGNDMTAQTRFTGEAGDKYPIYRNMETAEYALPTIVADGKWHQVHLYAEGAKVVDATLRFNFLDMKKAQYVLFTGFRCGVLKNASSDGYNEDRAYTELGWHLQSFDAQKLMINSKEIALKDGVSEYTVSAQEDAITAELGENSKSYVTEVKKLSPGKYQVTVAAPGYVKGRDDSDEITFRRKVDSSTGEISSSATAEAYKVLNGSMKRTYTVNLLLKSAEVKILVDGEEKTSLDGLSGGEEIILDVTYSNIKKENKTYITVLAIYADNNALAVVPVRKEISSDDTEIKEQYKYTLPEGDYTKAVAKSYVIDIENMFDVSK